MKSVGRLQKGGPSLCFDQTGKVSLGQGVEDNDWWKQAIFFKLKTRGEKRSLRRIGFHDDERLMKRESLLEREAWKVDQSMRNWGRCEASGIKY